MKFESPNDIKAKHRHYLSDAVIQDVNNSDDE